MKLNVTGSAKQIEWAENIVADAESAIARYAAKENSVISEENKLMACEKATECLNTMVAKYTTAAEIIDNRFSFERIADFLSKYAAQLQKKSSRI